jgi:hypothetical protein
MNQSGAFIFCLKSLLSVSHKTDGAIYLHRQNLYITPLLNQRMPSSGVITDDRSLSCYIFVFIENFFQHCAGGDNTSRRHLRERQLACVYYTRRFTNVGGRTPTRVKRIWLLKSNKSFQSFKISVQTFLTSHTANSGSSQIYSATGFAPKACAVYFPLLHSHGFQKAVEQNAPCHRGPLWHCTGVRFV